MPTLDLGPKIGRLRDEGGQVHNWGVVKDLSFCLYSLCFEKSGSMGIDSYPNLRL